MKLLVPIVLPVVPPQGFSVTGAVNESRFYLGQCGGNFKARYGNHLKSLRHERYKDETALSSYVWDAQRRGGNVSIKWSIVAIVPAHRPGERQYAAGRPRHHTCGA